MKCCVHYDNIKYDKKKIVAVVEETLCPLKQAKSAREQLGGDNSHSDQCYGVPETLTTGLGYHRACYKKFTNANAMLACLALELLRESIYYMNVIYFCEFDIELSELILRNLLIMVFGN